MSHLNINGVDKPLDHVYVNTGSVVKEAWEARDKSNHLLWGRADTFTGTNSISARCYGLPVKSWEIDGNSQQSGVPTPSDPIMPEFVGVRTGNLANLILGKVPRISDGTLVTFNGLTCEYVPITGMRDTFSLTFEKPEITKNFYVFFYSGDTLLTTKDLAYGTTITTYGVPNTVDRMRIRIDYNAYQIVSDVMLVKGSTPATAYEPYGWAEKITSAGQTVPVYLGEVSTTRRIKKLVFDGSESWNLSTQGNNTRAYTPQIPECMSLSPAICTHFDYNVKYVGYPKKGEFVINSSKAIIFGVDGNTFVDVGTWKSYLAQQYAAGTPVTVWYVLAEPETAITNEPLAKISTYADTLTSDQAGITIPAIDGSTTISVDTTLAPSKFEIKVHAKPIHYGFKIDKSVSDPSNAVIYTHDAVTMTPAGMDFTNGVFNYGSWENVWFIKNARPVMLGFDGTEAYDLDPNDYSKKLDGTPSDIADSTKNMNAMIAFPTVWIKRTDDASYNYIEISDSRLDSDFHAYAHEDASGVVKPYIYLPIYKGSMVDGKLRSISGVKPQSNTTAQQEVDAASALGTGWQIWDYTSKEMLCDLLTLISKSLDTQGKFGQGHSAGGSSASDFLDCGTLNDKGKFFGYSATTSQVKCFGMEALWAERWDRELGLILDTGVYKIKEHPAYNLTGEGYTSISASVAKCPTSNGSIKTEASTQFGSLPTVVGGTLTTYYCDYLYQNQSGTRVAFRGGHCDSGAYAGLRSVGVYYTASGSSWNLGAAPVYK